MCVLSSMSDQISDNLGKIEMEPQRREDDNPIWRLVLFKSRSNRFYELKVPWSRSIYALMNEFFPHGSSI